MKPNQKTINNKTQAKTSWSTSKIEARTKDIDH